MGTSQSYWFQYMRKQGISYAFTPTVALEAEADSWGIKVQKIWGTIQVRPCANFFLGFSDLVLPAPGIHFRTMLG